MSKKKPIDFFVWLKIKDRNLFFFYKKKKITILLLSGDVAKKKRHWTSYDILVVMNVL